MEAWEIIEDCELTGGIYNRVQFERIIAEMSYEEFLRFCRTVLHLYHFYSTNLHAWVTDESTLIEKLPDMFWQLKEIDFDAPLNFKRAP